MATQTFRSDSSFDAAAAPATRRCLSACMAADHRHAETLRHRGSSKARRRYPARLCRIEIASKRTEAACRDMRMELMA